jgi:UDP-N-acetylmuramoylalanine--D-glutamate ligase
MHPLTSIRQDFAGKKVLIFGLGMLGRGVGDAMFFAKLGCRVTVTDLKSEPQLQSSIDKLANFDIQYHLAGHREQDIYETDVIIRNASVPWEHPLLKKARVLGKPIFMDTQLFVSYAGIETIGITGTRGKTTTTTLIYEVLNRLLPGRQVLIGGNVKNVATIQLLEVIDYNKNPLIVLELSSWQLEAFLEHGLAPHLALITNLYPDHLNRYSSLKAYYQAKKAIFTHQTTADHLFLNQEIQESADWASEAKSQVHWFSRHDVPPGITLKLNGGHNRSNAAAALAVSQLYKLNRKDVLNILANQKPLEFRLQPLENGFNRTIINDSTSTTPIATAKALASIGSKSYLIFGGEDKNLPIGDAVTAINEYTKKVFLIKGSGTAKSKSGIKPNLIGGEFSKLKQAIIASIQASKPGDTILFSPGFTSFGMWDNEYHRGDSFNQLIFELEHEETLKK